MVFPVLTAFYAAVLGLIFAGLSGWVVAGRGKHRIIHGDGGNNTLNRRIRAHANFAEYVPLILLLVGLLEASGASHFTVRALLVPLVIARVLHPIGMVAPENSVQQYACRAPGAVITFVVLIAVSILLVIRV